MIKKTIIVTAGLAGLIFLFYAEEYARGWLMWEIHLRRCTKRGDQFDINALIPPRIPDDQNMAAAQIFKELMQTDKVDNVSLPIIHYKHVQNGWRVGAKEDMNAWRTAFSNDDLTVAMAQYNPIFIEISKASRRPMARIEHDYTNLSTFNSFNMLLKLGKLYRLKTLVDLEQGRSEAAVDDIRIMIRLANITQDEPIAISSLIRIGILAMTLQPFREGISAHQWNENEFRALGGDFAQLDLIKHMDLALRGERCYWNKTLQQVLKKPDQIYFNGFYDKPTISWLVKLTPNGWAYLNVRKSDIVYADYFIARTNIITTHRGQLPVERVEQICREDQRPRLIFEVLPYSVRNLIIGMCLKVGKAQTWMQCAAVACALERYRIAKGSYPDKLATLIPDYIERIPLDVIDGEPLRYQQDGKGGYVLYSIGWNRLDDKGVSADESATIKGAPSDLERKQGDWSWRIKYSP